MRKVTFIVVLGTVFVLNGCAQHNKVIIDPQGVDMAKYERDLALCKQISMQVDPKAGKRAAGGAVVGGALGAVVGDSDTVKKGAGVGLITGMVRGSRDTVRERTRVVKNCLRNRGYRVLN